jgi:hypothetical protein
MTDIGTLFDPLAKDGEARIIALEEAPGRIVALCPAAVGAAAHGAGFPYMAIIETADKAESEATDKRIEERVEDRAEQQVRPPVPVLMIYNRRFTRVIN